MSQHILETKGTNFIPAEQVKEKLDFETKEHAKDKDSGLPLYSTVGILAQEGSKAVTATLTIAAATAPVFTPLTPHALDGVLSVTDYIPTGSNRSSYSYKLVGQLVAPGAAAKAFPKND